VEKAVHRRGRSDRRTILAASCPGAGAGAVTLTGTAMRTIETLGFVALLTGATGPAWAGDGAQILYAATELPSHMYCGATYPAFVTAYNTGTTTWYTDWATGAGYKLGAVGDSDPFGIGTRVHLPSGALVPPGSYHAFSLPLVAPSVPGVYLTDWQMVHEGQAWFGQTVSQQVMVTCAPPVVLCPGVLADPSGGVPAGQALQTCIDQTPAGGTLALPPGTFAIDRQVVVWHPMVLSTELDAPAKTSCDAPSSPCATLRATPDLAFFADEWGGFFKVEHTSDVAIDHIVFDGNRQQRLGSAPALACAAADGSDGANVSIATCDDCTFTHSVSKNTLCGTALGWWGTGGLIAHNTFRDNGDHETNLMWADGLTLLAADETDVLDNRFVDNSDVALISGGAWGGVYAGNEIVQSGQKAFAAFMLHSFEGTTSGNFVGLLIEGNTIDCLGPSGQRMCNFGMNLGARAWDLSPTIFGGTVRSNSIANAGQGINVDGAGYAQTPLVLQDNVVLGQPSSGSFSCGLRATSALNIDVADSYVTLLGSTPSPITTTAWHSCH
jgi:hypothetical protein